MTLALEKWYRMKINFSQLLGCLTHFCQLEMQYRDTSFQEIIFRHQQFLMNSIKLTSFIFVLCKLHNY